MVIMGPGVCWNGRYIYWLQCIYIIALLIQPMQLDYIHSNSIRFLLLYSLYSYYFNFFEGDDSQEQEKKISHML
jgi:hypothetical protein